MLHSLVVNVVFLQMLCIRSLEAELASKTDDIAMYVESLTLKDEVVKSLTIQLADLQDNTGHRSDVGSSDTLAENTRYPERLLVIRCCLNCIQKTCNLLFHKLLPIIYY